VHRRERAARRARRLGRTALATETDESVDQAMTPGPSTVRPSIGAEALLERICSRNLTSFLVTTPDGRLVGLVLRGDLE
jgi:CBS domain-containing protein